MKRLFSFCLAVSVGVPGAAADPIEPAIMAIMQLSDEPNYSWVATVSDDARTYDIFGRTIRGGFTHVKMPVINTVRRKLGRSVKDTQIDLIFRGNVDCVIDTDEGWRRPAELPMLAWDAGGAARSGVGTRGSTFGIPRAVQGPRIFTPPVASQTSARDRLYSNLQLAISHPHEELGVIVGSYEQLNVEGDVVTGSLTNLGAQLLLVRDGQKYIEPISASGRFKLWLRNGIVAKYQVMLEGWLNIHVQSGRRKVEVHQVTDTILKDVGTTSFDVPDQARAKLGT
jgi:hypothetical protein